jgi:hypothetical protein
MEEKVLISIISKQDGLEIKVNEEAYGNLALVGVLEKLKLGLITEEVPKIEDEAPYIGNSQSYDA